MPERPDFGGEDFDEDAMARPGEPPCPVCGRFRRVVRFGRCEDCAEDVIAMRASMHAARDS